MAGLLAVRDALAAQGQVEPASLARQLGLSSGLTRALLEQLVQLGQARHVEQAASCGNCRGCSVPGNCAGTRYRIASTPNAASTVTGKELALKNLIA
ncbi:FeoC-like transcriptional regulator [Pseudomonas sp. LS44]|uniref:FeoC-like transcriptional regulator n=1 Tax=Pseudomonas sp. LS44 TaxID=1357074 RepID=UPI00215A1F0F|nr:FeoC-like transcriptional regulator [Pseudomonas sp. LS44]UVE18445.1 FeoC-like transcriptional regulator [Pseudomonas sp. LS44]